MHKTRSIPADFGSYPSGILPYSSQVFAPGRGDRMLWYMNQYGVDNYEDLLLRCWRAGHYYYGIDRSLNCTGLAESGVGTQSFYSSERKRPYFNNCTNRKTSGLIHTFTFGGYQKGTGMSNQSSSRNSYYCPCKYHYYPTTGFGSVNSFDKHTPVDWSNAQRTAWHEMQPRFEGDVSMFNFILELRDFKELSRLLLNKPIRKLRNYFRRNRKWLDPTKPLAQAHLMNEFALKPLLSDIITITSQMDEIVLSAQREFADAGLGRNSRHWSEEIIVNDDALSYGGYYYYYLADGEVETQRFTATMEHSYEYSARKSLDAFLRYWGLTPTWESIWNAIPFSFLLDYFVKIGRSIAAMEHDPNVDLELHQYCESILSTRSVGRHLVGDYLYDGIAVIDGKVRRDKLPLVSGVKTSLYTRRVTSPNKGAVLPVVTKPSSKQALNAAALLRCFV